MSPKNLTKITLQKFFQFGPHPIKISGYASEARLYQSKAITAFLFENYSIQFI